MALQVSAFSATHLACGVKAFACHPNALVASGNGQRSKWSPRCGTHLQILRVSEQSGVSTIAVGGVMDVDKDTFWPTVEAAGDKLVVLDMYTQWCGPCKIMHPKIAKLSEKYTDVVFLRLDCNQQNKSLAKELGVRVVPTFKLFSKKNVVAVVTGAKFEELVETIDNARAEQLRLSNSV